MGYYTKHKLKVLKGNIDLIVELRKESEGAESAIEDDGEYAEECKWYGHEEDMRAFSLKHPEALFELSGEGEESGDFWIEYYQGGKMQ